MKKLFCLLLAAATLLLGVGCAPQEDENSVEFYYLRQSGDFVYQEEEGILAAEKRTISDPNSDLKYLLTLYLEGPLSEGLLSPFPQGTQVLDVEEADGLLTITLTEEFAALQDMDQTLACACLCRTCFTLTEAEHITLLCGQTSMDWHRDSFTLTDDSVNTATQ